MSNKAFIKSNILIIFIANSANIFAYLFQFIMGRYLSVEDFGVLNAINSLSVLVGAITSVIPYIVAKYVIEFKNNSTLVSLLVWKIFQFSSILIFLLFIVIFFAIDGITSYLNLDSKVPIYIFLFSLMSSLYMSIFYGIMQGLLMYVRSSIKSASWALLRFLFALLFVAGFGYSYNGALSSAVFANIFIGVWVYSVVNKHINFCRPENISMPEGLYVQMFTYALPVALTWIVIGITTNIDVVLVKHYCSNVDTGEYSVAAVIGKIAVFLPGVLLAVLFPQVSQNNKDGVSSVGAIVVIMSLTLLLSGGFTLVVYLFPEFIITLLFGDKYIGGAEVLTIITFAMALVAVLSVLFNFFLAKHLYSFLYYTWFVIGFFGFIIEKYMHNSPLEIAKAVLYGMIVLVIVNSFIMFYYYNKERKSIERTR